MIRKLKEIERFEITFLLALMTLFCFSLSVFRYYISDTKVFLFLNWNLFLAWIPFVISSFLMLFKIRSKLSVFAAIAVWILFFPHSPYILTDLFHLKSRNSIPVWYDLVVILSYAWTGLFCGFISLFDIEKLLLGYFKQSTIRIITISFLFLTGFGVYLGRFLRWNSWDVINNPFGLFNDILVRIVYPMNHAQTWGVTVFMGVMLNFMYFMMKSVKSIDRQTVAAKNQ